MTPSIAVDDSLRRLDLNLLVTLDALLAEQNVTRAAARLHLSQPAVSVQLAKLREAFADPLLLPGPRGMRPTARALELRQPLHEALAALGQAIAPSAGFDPAHTTHTWRVAATDYGASTIVLPALARLRAAAPGTRLAVLELKPPALVRQLEQGELDLALHAAELAPPDLRRRPLFQERYVLVARAGHPSLTRQPTLAEFCALEHAIVSPDGGGFIGATDQVLAAQGLARRVVLSVPHFLFLEAALTASDLVAMLPARQLRPGSALQVVAPPLELPGFEMLMLWHERLHRDPAHQWLREQFAAAVEAA